MLKKSLSTVKKKKKITERFSHTTGMLHDAFVAPLVMPDGADVHSFTLLSITIIVVVAEKGTGGGDSTPCQSSLCYPQENVKYSA